MSRRGKIDGECKICQFRGELSYEHVPPKGAFNNFDAYYEMASDVTYKNEKDIFEGNYRELKKQKLVSFKQGGIGFNSICNQCNNETGSWYAKDYIDWARQTMIVLLKAEGKYNFYYPTYIFPLRIIKQIITMFFSINVEGFKGFEPELVKFIKNKEQVNLSSDYRIFCYHNIEGQNRYIANNFLSTDGLKSTVHMSEITFQPLGFVMTIKSESPDSRLTEISHFANYGYDERIDYNQKFNTLPTHLPHSPADYRSREEISIAINSATI